MAVKKINFNGVRSALGSDAQDVSYTNDSMEGVSNVKQAIDALAQDGQSVSGVTVGSGRNLYNKSNPAVNLYKYQITPTWSKVINQNNNWTNSYLAKIPVEEGKTYIIYHDTASFRSENGYPCMYVWLDSDNDPIVDENLPSEIVVSGSSNQVRQFLILRSITQTLRWEGGDEVVDIQHRRLTAPSGAAYLVLQNDLWSETLQVEEGYLPTQYAAYSDNGFITHINGKPIRATEVSNNGVIKPHVPLNVYIAGDSIATFIYGSWNVPILEKFSFKNYRNVARGGGHWAFLPGTKWSDIVDGNPQASGADWKGNTAAANVWEIINGVKNNGWEEPELLIIHDGTNDANNGDTVVGDADTVFNFSDSDYSPTAFSSIIESVEDALENEEDVDLIEMPSKICSVVGGMRMAVEWLWKHFPYCQVLVTTPLQAGPNTKRLQICEQIKKAAAYLSVPVLDFHATAGIYTPIRTNFLEKYMSGGNDGLHPYLQTGGRRLADILGRYLVAHYGDQPWFPMDNSGNLDDA